MVIALLAVLGVDLMVIVVFLGLVLSRRRCLKRYIARQLYRQLENPPATT